MKSEFAEGVIAPYCQGKIASGRSFSAPSVVTQGLSIESHG